MNKQGSFTVCFCCCSCVCGFGLFVLFCFVVVIVIFVFVTKLASLPRTFCCCLFRCYYPWPVPTLEALQGSMRMVLIFIPQTTSKVVLHRASPAARGTQEETSEIVVGHALPSHELSRFGGVQQYMFWFNRMSPTVKVNGQNTQWFSIECGCRQGDPVSPYLFILSVEILAIMIRENVNIKGVDINGTEHKIAQFADDTTNK